MYLDFDSANTSLLLDGMCNVKILKLSLEDILAVVFNDVTIVIGPESGLKLVISFIEVHLG